ncbi:hypothetical protein KC342_g93 [Hortaea werneckii]|nr:hypothetical protein KC342_g93 [Hortaea werneckii]
MAKIISAASCVTGECTKRQCILGHVPTHQNLLSSPSKDVLHRMWTNPAVTGAQSSQSWRLLCSSFATVGCSARARISEELLSGRKWCHPIRGKSDSGSLKAVPKALVFRPAIKRFADIPSTVGLLE